MNQLLTYGLAINQALDEVLKDPKVILLGQDIRDPFGGCYRVTQGLSTKYPKQVINTPISEAATVGVAVGLAMQGYKPVVEIMFSNFLTLAMDQIFHNAVMVNRLIQEVPLTIRTVIGKKDYGFTHEGREVVDIFSKFIPVLNCKPSEYAKYINQTGPKILLEDSSLYTKRWIE